MADTNIALAEFSWVFKDRGRIFGAPVDPTVWPAGILHRLRYRTIAPDSGVNSWIDIEKDVVLGKILDCMADIDDVDSDLEEYHFARVCARKAYDFRRREAKLSVADARNDDAAASHIWWALAAKRLEERRMMQLSHAQREEVLEPRQKISELDRQLVQLKMLERMLRG